MKLHELLEDGRVIKGVNTTCDVGPNEIQIQAKKFGFDVDADGYPKSILESIETIKAFGHTLPGVNITVGSAVFQMLLEHDNFVWRIKPGHKRFWLEEKAKGANFLNDVAPKLEQAVYDLLEFVKNNSFDATDYKNIEAKKQNYARIVNKKYSPKKAQQLISQYDREIEDTLKKEIKFGSQFTLTGRTNKASALYRSWNNPPKGFKVEDESYNRTNDGIVYVRV